MATERVIDLEHSRYCDRPYEGEIPGSLAAAEEALAGKRRRALLRVKAAAVGNPVLTDLLTALGLDE